jgi:hypothetical protein
MQKEYFWVPAVVLLLLFLAGGVYSQLEQNQAVSDAIQRGVGFLSVQPQYDSELLVFYLIQQENPSVVASVDFSSKLDFTDDFHSPLKQFLKGEKVDVSSVSAKTLDSLYYSDFVDYFSCASLTSEWVDSLRGLKNDGSIEGAYHSSHSLLLLELIRRDYFGGRCGDNPEMLLLVESVLSEKAIEVQSELPDKSFFDAWVERVAVLAYAGYAVSSEDVDYILSKQSPNGGWSPQDFGEDAFEEERSHTTALAVWALMGASS